MRCHTRRDKLSTDPYFTNVFSKYIDVFIQNIFFLIISLQQSVRLQCFRFKFISDFLNDLRFLGCETFPMEAANDMPKYFRKVNPDFLQELDMYGFSYSARTYIGQYDTELF